MKTSNTHKRVLHFAQVATLITGISLVSAGSTASFLAMSIPELGAGTTLHEAAARIPGKVTQTLAPLSAPLTVSGTEDIINRVLLFGMLLILTALLVYTIHVVQEARRQERTPWGRVRHWFQSWMDMEVTKRMPLR